MSPEGGTKLGMLSAPLLDQPSLRERSDGIDLLRLGLAFWVVMTHLLAWGGFTATGQPVLLANLEVFNETVLFQRHGEMHPAVLAFIVLSGYCIHRNGARRDGWSLRGYALKRAFRIVPVFVFATIVGALIFAFVWRANPAYATRVTATTGITVGGMVRKLFALTAVVPVPHMARNYAANGYQGNGALYTVAAEIWLYVIYAVAMTLLVGRRIRERLLFAAVGLLTCLFLVLVAIHPDLQDWYFNASMVGFLPAWWIGAKCVAELSPRRVVILAATSVIVWSACTLYLQRHGGLAIVEVRLLAFALLIGLLIRRIDRARLKLPSRLSPMTRSGYSLYALHGPVLCLLIAFGVPWPLVATGAVLVGVEVFRLLERPATLYGRKVAFSRRRRTWLKTLRKRSSGLA